MYRDLDVIDIMSRPIIDQTHHTITLTKSFKHYGRWQRTLNNSIWQIYANETRIEKL